MIEFNDEMLMRFADGELDNATSARIEVALATDDVLVARLALFMETRSLSQEALKPLLDEPVPASLVASVEKMIAAKNAAFGEPQSNVVPLVARKVRTTSVWRLPLAASLAALLGGAAGFWLADREGGAPAAGVQIAGIEEKALTAALATFASGTETQLPRSGGRLRAIATFRDAGSTLCREFEIDNPNVQTVVAVACHQDDGWHVTFAVVAPGDDGGYAPASSMDALDAYLLAVEAGAPLDAAEEAGALRAISASQVE